MGVSSLSCAQKDKGLYKAQLRDMGYYYASEGSQKSEWVSFTLGRESWHDCSVQLLPCDLEASWDSMGLTASGLQFSLQVRKKADVAMPATCGWSPQPHWNTMAAPDSARSHTVLAHWKSYKTRVVQGSQAVHEVFPYVLWFSYHECRLQSSLEK